MDQEKGRPKTIGHKIDQKLETVRKNYRTVQQDSAMRMKELKSQSRSTNRIVKNSHKQFRASRAKVKKIQKEYKNIQKQGRELRKEGKALRPEEIKKQAFLKQELDKNNKKQAFLKQELDKAKLEKKTSKRTFKVAQEANGGSRKKKFLRAAKQSVERVANQQASSTAHQDDTLSDIARTKNQYQDIQIQGKRIKTIGKYSGKLGQGVVKSSYSLGNRFYNKANGRGFTRTPKEFSWEGKLSRQIQAYRNRLAASKTGKATKKARKVYRFGSKPIKAIIKNPFGFKAYLIAFGLLLFLAILGIGSSGITRQDEFDMNDTWLYLSKLDREKSNDKVDYWTKIDDPLLYLNYKYDDISDKLRIDGNKYFSQNTRGKLYLDTLWKNLNGDKDNLKTMEDLYTKNDLYKLSEDELEEYKELLEIARDSGKYMLLQELDNPFYTEDQPESEAPLQIIERFGYKTKTEIFNGSVLQATGGQTLLAVLDGKVEVNGNDLEISDENSKFLYKNVDTIRYKTGDHVKSGDIIGKVASEGNQTVYYQKLEPDRSNKKDKDGNVEKSWTYVNVGFYFQRVEYTQATSVVSSIETSGEKGKRARAFADAIKKNIPEATDEGIAAVLGGFDIESSITFKRYETDFLTNNQFDKVAKEPTAENLVGNWDAFQAMYPNLRLNKGGYLVNGLHYIGIGIGQFTGPRALALWNFAKDMNGDIWSAEVQTKFLLEADDPLRREAFKRIVTSTGSVEALAEDFLNSWLGVPGNKLLERQTAARQWLNFLKNKGGGSTGVSSQQVPAEYKDKLPYGLPTDQAILEGQGYPGNAYALGNCTWYVYNRFAQIGTGIYPYLGNANQWVDSGQAQGYEISTTPKPGSAVVFMNGVAGASPIYGHVGFCEYVNSDGSFLMSEMNFAGLYLTTWRTLTPQSGIYFVTPK
ncbi:phage tail tip lysozyme [Streptococcus pneumoniae]|uniref:phage tail tip lysozyme n=1 Tax=Streptococcus pneumoniae TaxID=1313 RepID=UPI000E02E7B7|nr:phage tail tip lysozyme [Streptococcus pneumoniae]SUO26270.1 CHAP domain-containing protein [Streptococcus pneumoniae]